MSFAAPSGTVDVGHALDQDSPTSPPAVLNETFSLLLGFSMLEHDIYPCPRDIG